MCDGLTDCESGDDGRHEDGRRDAARDEQVPLVAVRVLVLGVDLKDAPHVTQSVRLLLPRGS